MLRACAVSHPVFISYSRRTSTAQVQSLAVRLGDLVFVDTSAIEDGSQFPEHLLNAILDASVVVIFATAAYAESQFCRLEMRMALAAGDQTASRLVLALGEGFARVVETLPVEVASGSWPGHEDAERLERLVRERLKTSPSVIRDRLAPDEAKRLSTAFLNESSLPEAQSLHGIVCSFPSGSAVSSIGSRFVGRADLLRKIHQILSEGLHAGSQRTARIAAGGGFGKTRIAVEYLHRYGRHYPGGIFWLDASSRVLDEEFWRIINTLDPSAPSLGAIRREGRSVQHELGRRLRAISKPALYVIDNIPEPGSGKDPSAIGDFCPAAGAVTILATSRQDTREENVTPISMDILERDSAVLLLTENLHGAAALSWADWGRIAAWVGDLPIAIDLLNRSLALSSMSPRQLLDRIGMTDLQSGTTAELDTLRDAMRGQVPENALRGVTEVFLISFQKLDRTAQYVAQVLAHLAPAPIPEEFMKALPGNGNSPAVRAALRSRHFLSSGDDLTFGAMHRLLADFLRSVSRDKVPELLERGCAIFGQIMTPERSRDPGHWRVMTLCREHAETLVIRSSATDNTLRKRSVAYRFWRAWLSHMSTMDIADSRGSVRYWICRVLLGRSFAMDLMVLASTSMGLKALLFVGEQGDDAGAKRLLTPIVEMSTRVLGEEHLYTLTAMNNLAWIHRNQGDLPGARQLLDRVLQVMMRTLGERHMETLNSMDNLASILRDLGEYDGARRLQERALEVITRAAGEEDPRTLRTRSNLALTLEAQGDRKGARGIQEQVLKLATRAFGEEHPDTLASMNNLGNTLRDQGEYERAKQLQDRLLQLTTRVLGEEHPHTLTSMGNLALTLESQGDHAGAQQLLHRALDVSTRVLGAEHPHTLTRMRNLAMSAGAQDDRAAAQRALEFVLDARTRVLGEEHPDTVASRKDLSVFSHRVGNTEDLSRTPPQKLFRSSSS